MHRYCYLVLSLFIVCCQSQAANKIFKKELLEKYFETTDINTRLDARTLEIDIKNSQLITNKQRRMGDAWVSAEAAVSAGAVAALENVDTNKIENIQFRVSINNKVEEYRYSVRTLLQANDFVKKSKNFIFVYRKSGYEKAKPFLSERITKESTDDELQSLLSTVFPHNKIDSMLLGAFKQEDTILSLYIDVYYSGLGGQTYVFTYFVDGTDSRIMGISVPQAN